MLLQLSGGGYYCFNDAKAKSTNSLSASDSEDQESGESFPPIFSFEPHDEKIDLKEKASNLTSMVSFLNKTIDKLDSENLSKLKNVQDFSNLNDVNGFEDLDNQQQSPEDDQDQEESVDEEEGNADEEANLAENIDNFVTSLSDHFSSDTSLTSEIKQLEDNKDKLKALFEKIKNNKSTQ